MRVLCRAVLVIVALLAAAAVAVWQLAALVGASAGLAVSTGSDPARVLVAWLVLLCAALAGGWWLWLVGSVVATTIAAARRAAAPVPRWLVAPRILRAALGLLVGTTSVGTAAISLPSSVASPTDGHHRVGPVLPGALAGLRLPDRVTGAAPRVRRPRPATSATRVRPGDSLCSIAADLLTRPTAARVAGTWPRLYAANRAGIGPDPDLIRPGTRLVVPTSLQRHDQPRRGGSR
jgi:hypothetical protein